MLVVKSNSLGGTSPMSTSSAPTTYINPYVQMAMRVMDSARKLEAEAIPLAALEQASKTRELTKAEQRRIKGIYNRMDKVEYRLVRKLNKEEWFPKLYPYTT
jgi:hypothetical protein